MICNIRCIEFVRLSTLRYYAPFVTAFDILNLSIIYRDLGVFAVTIILRLLSESHRK